MKPLFDKTYDELSEAFVRARFAEPNIFGRPDIEGWLEGQRENLGKGIDPDPWTQDGFDNVVDADWNSNEPSTWKKVASLLLDYVTPSQSKPSWSDRDPSNSRLVEVIETLRAGGAQVFYWVNAPMYNDFMGIAIVEGKAYGILTEGGVDVAGLGTTNKGMAVEFMLEEVRGDGRKALQALEYLILEYRMAIAAARESAERDFDEAVAVSADGTKIVKADEVVVIADDMLVCFPSSAFKKPKILRNEYMERYKLTNAALHPWERGVERFPEWLASLIHSGYVHSQGGGQLLVLGSRSFDRKCRLVTELRYCPSPLPDGGREIRI